MQQAEQEWVEVLAEPRADPVGIEKPSLVKVLTDFLQGASRHVLEEDCDSYYLK